MSEFDKEAEREKLREQLEAEQEDREATQRMSELLLGGATMTGKHCENCASPIFRRNGQEFCPNCNQVVGETGQQRASEAGESSAQEANQAGETVETAGTSQPQVEPTNSISTEQPEGTAQRQPETQSVPSAGAGEVAVSASADGDLVDARAALTRKLSQLAAQAEATDDVGRAQELLAATREAAEALASLEKVDDSL